MTPFSIEDVLDVLVLIGCIVVVILIVALVLAPVAISYLCVAGLASWWWFFASLPGAIVGAAMGVVMFLMGKIDVWPG